MTTQRTSRRNVSPANTVVLPSRAGSKYETALALRFAVSGLLQPVLGYPFAQALGRRWKFDLAWPSYLLALEIEGGIYAAGRHVRGADFERDAIKYNTALLLGWRVLRFGPKAVETDAPITAVKLWLARLDMARPVYQYAVAGWAKRHPK